MKKRLAFFLMIALLCAAVFSRAESSQHEHIWGEWLPTAEGHAATCAEDGETLTARHYNFSTGTVSQSAVCAICGQYKNGVFPLIAGAQAQSQKEKPSSQRGSFMARGMKAPYENAPNVLYAFTVAYVQNGTLVTWKDISTVTLPLDAQLPEDYQLIRITPAAGDDSVQNPEQQIEMESTWAEGALTFVTKSPALYLILSKESF